MPSILNFFRRLFNFIKTKVQPKQTLDSDNITVYVDCKLVSRKGVTKEVTDILEDGKAHSFFCTYSG